MNTAEFSVIWWFPRGGPVRNGHVTEKVAVFTSCRIERPGIAPRMAVFWHVDPPRYTWVRVGLPRASVSRLGPVEHELGGAAEVIGDIALIAPDFPLFEDSEASNR